MLIWEVQLALAGSPDSGASRRAREILKSLPDSMLMFYEDWMGLFAAQVRDWSELDRWNRRIEMVLPRWVRGDTLRARMSRGEARLFRALTAQRLGDTIGSLNEMRAAVRDYPAFWGADRFMRHEIGRRLFATGDFDGAKRYLESIGGFDWYEMPAVVEYDLGRIYERLGDREQAIHHYGRMVRWWKDADPEFKPLWEEGRRALARLTAER